MARKRNYSRKRRGQKRNRMRSRKMRGGKKAIPPEEYPLFKGYDNVNNINDGPEYHEEDNFLVEESDEEEPEMTDEEADKEEPEMTESDEEEPEMTVEKPGYVGDQYGDMGKMNINELRGGKRRRKRRRTNKRKSRKSRKTRKNKKRRQRGGIIL